MDLSFVYIVPLYIGQLDEAPPPAGGDGVLVLTMRMICSLHACTYQIEAYAWKPVYIYIFIHSKKSDTSAVCQNYGNPSGNKLLVHVL